jgi:trehalose 6-phosphate phosphatase
MTIPNREKIWFFDFDGTLSPIVPDRGMAELHPACVTMLADLAKMPLQHVAVLSSRRLDDLVGRIPIGGVFLGGTSGTEWQAPGGHRMSLSGKSAETLETVRRELLPEILALADLPGVGVEDKAWSLALHTRHAPQDSRSRLIERLSRWNPGHRVRVFRGPEVHEIQLAPRISKSSGVRMFCRFMKFAPGPGTLFYAGDDENDAIAMRLVTRLGGTAVTVGVRGLIPTSYVVKDQQELADMVCRLLNHGALPGRDDAKEVEV